MNETISSDVLVIGAGVVGLAVAEKLSRRYKVILVEKNPQFGQETSSRNSEVVHSGIHYPLGSQKTKFCLEGQILLYDFCKKYNVPHNVCGKSVIATEENELAYLNKLSEHCKQLNIDHHFESKVQIKQREPLIEALQSVYFPKTGIIDSHILMQRLESLISENGGLVAYQHRVKNIYKDGKKWTSVVNSLGIEFEVQSERVLNCAGLGAAELSNKTLKTEKYQHRFCRGRYFTLSTKYQGKFNHLVYPTPQKDGLGVHVTIDMNQMARLGPDVDWQDSVDYAGSQSLYDCNWDELRNPFYLSVKKYAPSIKEEDLSPGLIGIRPKLFLDGTVYPDFLIEDFGGFIHYLGFESPGLTSSLALASTVS